MTVQTPSPQSAGRSQRHLWIAAVALACALAAGWAADHPISMACGLVVAALALVTADPGYVPVHTYGLRRVPDGIPPVLSIGRTAHHVAVLAGGVSIAVLALLDVPVSIAIAVLLLVALATWLRAAPWIVGRRHASRVRRALAAHAPTVAMVFTGRSGGPWQLGMWEPILTRSGEPGVIVTLHAKYLSMILNGPDFTMPVVQLGSRGGDELDDALPASIRVCCYVQNSAHNEMFLARSEPVHLWLGHGDSDKPTSYSPRLATYDVVTLSGQAAADRLERHGVEVDPGSVRLIGRPQTRGVVRVEVTPPVGLETILYAPTWARSGPGQVPSSLAIAPALVRSLIDRGTTVVFRPHPLSYRWRASREVIQQVRRLLADHQSATGTPHRFGRRVDQGSLAEIFNGVDALITDVSAMASDFLASQKPLIVVGAGSDEEAWHAAFPVTEAAYLIHPDLTDLADVLDDIVFHDRLAPRRARMRVRVLGEFDGEQADRTFIQFIRTVCQGAS